MTDLLFITHFVPKVLETPKTHYTQYNYQYLNGTGCCSRMKKIGILDVFGLFKETASFVTLKCTINENISL